MLGISSFTVYYMYVHVGTFTLECSVLLKDKQTIN